MDWSSLVTLAKPYIASTVRHGASVAAGVLAANGIISQSAETQDASVIGAIALGLIAQGWSWYQKHHQAQKVDDAGIAGAAAYIASVSGVATAKLSGGSVTMLGETKSNG